jgi:hypothetical protein
MRCLMRGASSRQCRLGQMIARILRLCLMAAYFCATAANSSKGLTDSGSNSRGMSAAEHSRTDASAWSGGQGTPSQGLLRLRGRSETKQRAQPTALDSLMHKYAERHKQCLFDDSYRGQYIIVSMSDNFSGKLNIAKPQGPRLSYVLREKPVARGKQILAETPESIAEWHSVQPIGQPRGRSRDQVSYERWTNQIVDNWLP